MRTLRRENNVLHENLMMLKEYSQGELDMIEAHITTFRKDFKKMKAL